jgi:hypothetical protein
MKSRKLKESYIIMDLIYNNFWDGIFFTSHPEKSKVFESETEAEEEIKNGRVSSFRGLMCVKKVYPNI